VAPRTRESPPLLRASNYTPQIRPRRLVSCSESHGERQRQLAMHHHGLRRQARPGPVHDGIELHHPYPATQPGTQRCEIPMAMVSGRSIVEHDWRRRGRRLAGSSPKREKCLARGLQQTLESSRSGTNTLRAVPLGTLRKADLEASPHRLSASPEGLLLSLVGAEGARGLPLNDHLVPTLLGHDIGASPADRVRTGEALDVGRHPVAAGLVLSGTASDRLVVPRLLCRSPGFAAHGPPPGRIRPDFRTCQRHYAVGAHGEHLGLGQHGVAACGVAQAVWSTAAKPLPDVENLELSYHGRLSIADPSRLTANSRAGLAGLPDRQHSP